MVEVMFAITMLLILVAVFAKITERTFEHIQLNYQKTELALRLDKWTIEKLNGTLTAVSYQENVS